MSLVDFSKMMLESNMTDFFYSWYLLTINFSHLTFNFVQRI